MDFAVDEQFEILLTKVQILGPRGAPTTFYSEITRTKHDMDSHSSRRCPPISQAEPKRAGREKPI